MTERQEAEWWDAHPEVITELFLKARKEGKIKRLPVVRGATRSEPFPNKDVDSLMSVKVWDPGGRGWRTNYTTDQFLEIAERNTIFDSVIASTISDVL